MRRAWVAIVLAACGGSSNKSSTMAKSEGPACAAVAESMVAIIAHGKESTKALVDTKDAFAAIIRTRCDEDAWTVDAKQCLLAMTSNDDAIRCSSLLTDEQQANLERNRTAKFGRGNEPPPAPAMEAEKVERAAPKPTKSNKTGDPCDGGE